MQREQVHDAEPAAGPAQHRRQVQPAQVPVAGDPPERRPDGAAGLRGCPVRAGLADEQQDRDGDRDGRQPERDRGAAPADRGDQRRADDRDDDRPDVAAGDVGADREAAPLRRELLGQQAVADRMLGRSADPRHDVRDRERREARRERLEREPAAEQEPADSRAGGAARRPGSGRRS